MGILTLIRYLCGDRQAILDIAASRHALWLGLLFVLSAGFAREYDGEDLLHEPWHLLLPLGASLVTASLLFGLLWLVCIGWKTMSLQSYRSFLTLYWMTAPLAWLYAIPVEQFLSAADSVRANLWLLALVALWRVVLMIRVVSVLYGLKIWQAAAVVMLFADTVALVLVRLTPVPIIAVMGGVRLTESEQIIQGTTMLVGFLTFTTWIVWLLAALAAAVRYRRPPMDDAAPRTIPVRFSAWGLGVASLLIWAFILPITQPTQQLRYAVERDLLAGNYAEALATMSQHEPTDFPPHWEPPPRTGYRDQHPPIVEVLNVVLASPPAPWVEEMFLEKYLGRVPFINPVDANQPYPLDERRAETKEWLKYERNHNGLPRRRPSVSIADSD